MDPASILSMILGALSGIIGPILKDLFSAWLGDRAARDAGRLGAERDALITAKDKTDEARRIGDDIDRLDDDRPDLRADFR